MEEPVCPNPRRPSPQVDPSGPPGPRDRDETERVRRLYASYTGNERKARAWRAENPGNRAIRAELWLAMRHAASRPLLGEGDILDAGCGNGFWLRSLLQHGIAPARLHGVDLLPERLAACRHALQAEVDLRRADVRRLPYPDDTFDLILMFTVLSSLARKDDIRRAISEAKRVARPAGAILIYEPRYWNPVNRATLRTSDLVDDEFRSKREWPVTVWPPLARRLGPFTDRLYPRLAGRRWATSHRLIAGSA
jgi:SAM-dependent methyltransferase